MAREVFKKFKACITIKGINEYRKLYDAINIIYKSLQEDRDRADISDIIRELHAVVDNAIQTHHTDNISDDFTTYDISKIDFDRLRKEFERSSSKNSTAQNLKHAIEMRLRRMIHARGESVVLYWGRSNGADVSSADRTWRSRFGTGISIPASRIASLTATCKSLDTTRKSSTRVHAKSLKSSELSPKPVIQDDASGVSSTRG